MFGFSGLFGDYADIIHAAGGRLRAVVQNVRDPTPVGRKSFADRVAEYDLWLEENDLGGPLSIVALEDFLPEPDEHYVLGFRGRQQQRLLSELESKFDIRPEALISPSATVSPTARIGNGAIIGAGCIVASQVSLGEHTLLNRGASIGHECDVAAFANIGPGVRLASSVRVGEGAVLGIGSTVIEHLTIGEDAYVAAGAVVIRDVPANSLVAGVPATVKKRK
jgi:sugar O-acyltransferase (sialic acid O-acetyltransferase NeuD family)